MLKNQYRKDFNDINQQKQISVFKPEKFKITGRFDFQHFFAFLFNNQQTKIKPFQPQIFYQHIQQSRLKTKLKCYGFQSAVRKGYIKLSTFSMDTTTTTKINIMLCYKNRTGA